MRVSRLTRLYSSAESPVSVDCLLALRRRVQEGLRDSVFHAVGPHVELQGHKRSRSIAGLDIVLLLLIGDRIPSGTDKMGQDRTALQTQCSVCHQIAAINRLYATQRGLSVVTLPCTLDTFGIKAREGGHERIGRDPSINQDAGSMSAIFYFHL